MKSRGNNGLRDAKGNINFMDFFFYIKFHVLLIRFLKLKPLN